MNFNLKRPDTVSVLILLLVFAVSIPGIYAGVTVDITEKSISVNDGASNAQGPQMIVNGNTIYTVWYNGTTSFNCSTVMCNVTLAKSTNNGTTFSTPIIIGNSTTNNPTPQIAVGSGNNVYVVWQNGTNVEFIASSDGGASFTAVKTLSTDVDSTGAKPQIVTNASGNNVYVGWTADNDYLIANSDDDGASFSAGVDVGDHSSGRRSLSLDVSPDTVYAIMQSNVNVNFVRSTNNGTSFSNPTTPSDGIIGAVDASTSSRRGSPDVLANDTNVYVVWREDGNINFRKSIDSGVTFATKITLGDTRDFSTNDPAPKIINGTGGTLFVVWEHDYASLDVRHQIDLAISTDSGDSFDTAVNISGTAYDASTPQIVTDGNLVYITWVQTLGVDEDIRLVTGNGTDFGSPQTLSTSVHDIAPTIDTFGDKAFILWQSHPNSTTTDTIGEMNFTAVTFSPIRISFNSTQYTTFNPANVTITDVDSSGTLSATITSDTSATGITLSFDETGTGTGIFNNTITFSESLDSSAADKRLKVTAGDTITTTFSSVTGSSIIFPRTVDIESNSYNQAEKPSVRVIDENSNTDSSSKQSVVVTITSTQTGASATLTLFFIHSGTYSIFSTSSTPGSGSMITSSIVGSGSTITSFTAVICIAS